MATPSTGFANRTILYSSGPFSCEDANVVRTSEIIHLHL